ncbi:hypothetical protein L1887_30349 [Cichorium endivia]|nr:hypothetical protein L1887_30349 [Cichorium endivia]
MITLEYNSNDCITSWSRKSDGIGKVNPEGVAYYNRLVDYLLQKDRMKIWMTFNETRFVAALGYDNGLMICCEEQIIAADPYGTTFKLFFESLFNIHEYAQRRQLRLLVPVRIDKFNPITVYPDEAERSFICADKYLVSVEVVLKPILSLKVQVSIPRQVIRIPKLASLVKDQRMRTKAAEAVRLRFGLFGGRVASLSS